MIDNPRVVRVCNEVIRPVADKLAGLCSTVDTFAAQVLDPEFLSPLGITPEMIAAELMPTTESFSALAVDDGASADGRPLCDRRKVLALIRVILQLKEQKDATVYGVPGYVQSVAYSLAPNPRG